MLYRTLGHTGEKVSAIGVGGHHLGLPDVSEDLAIRIIRNAIERGINFLDNSWDYHEGKSERRMGRALRDGYRDKVFLMTKIDGRSREAAQRQLEESFERLGVDVIDLVQHHEIIRFDDANRIFDDQGANAVLLEAKAQGRIRYIGFTGHKDPQVHLHMLEMATTNGFTFDAVQMPLNVMDAHYRSFERIVLPELVRQNIGVLGMKSMGNGIILRSGVASARECLEYALNLPTSVVITGIETMERLDQAVATVESFRPLSAAAVKKLLAKTAQAGGVGEFELFKTSSLFDSTASHPEWLGEESDRVRQMAPN